MDNVIGDLYQVICQRKEQKIEGSYTCYLFEKGLDKILKKCGEECAEVIIAAKNTEKEQLVSEVCDLIYHILVLLSQKDIAIDEVFEELFLRAQKQRNLKPQKAVDKDS
jgi:phosphoribosyl-ATP pyrophosphohydrolase